MKTFIVLYFSLFLVGGSKGMSYFTFETSNFAWLKCCVMPSPHIPKIECLSF